MRKAQLMVAAGLMLSTALASSGNLQTTAQDLRQGLAPDAISSTPATATGTTTGAGNSASALPSRALPSEELVRKSSFIARQLASDEYFDKAAAANPALVAAVCSHQWAATIVAKHKHIAQIADADHLLCRRLTRFYPATVALLHNPHADHVIQLDPQGIYYAISKRPSIARLVAGHVMYYEMVQENPDLGTFMVAHMK